MTRLQVHDTVVLKDQPTFVGSIERTNLLDSEPLEDCLIIAHTEVPAAVLKEFVDSGTPPAGYVFVQFASQEKGSSLVAEDDLVLIDRLFEIGDVVKVTGTQTIGTVVDVQARYVLSPVWPVDDPSQFFTAEPANQRRTMPHDCTAACSVLDPRISHTNPARLLGDVPFEELKRAQDFIEGDYVLQQDWLGVVDGVDLRVVILLADRSIVVVADAEDLFIPIPDYGKPLVSLPEFDGIPRPAHVFAAQGWGNLIPPEDLETGQFVVTKKKNVQNGRWLRGSYKEDTKPEGYVLMVKCGSLDVQWLVCNPLTEEKPDDFHRPRTLDPYENLDYFKQPQELRRHKRLTLYDPSKHVTHSHDRSRDRSINKSRTKSSHVVNLSSSFNVGQRVRFRDLAGAAVKYAGNTIDNVLHNAFRRVSKKKSLGFDLNEFEIVQSKQTALIRLQDGSISEQLSTHLTKHSLFESDIMPADIVVAREGMQQVCMSENNQVKVDFNEMTIFEKEHDLYPEKVGIIQSIQPSERLATVRWFEQPRVMLGASGNTLVANSRFGKISDLIETVSLYEILTFDGLVRKLRDIVIIPPSKVSQKTATTLSEGFDVIMDDNDARYITSLSHLDDRSPAGLLSRLQKTALFADFLRDLKQSATSSNTSYHTDWMGEISELRTDGKVVIRVNSEHDCEDVVLDHDQILLFCDEQIWGADLNDSIMSTDESLDDTGSDLSILEETVEYEGGERMDDDPDDENWASEDEADEEHVQAHSSDVDMNEDTTLVEDRRGAISPSYTIQAVNNAIQPPVSTPQMQSQARPLASYYSGKESPPFLCLEREPPPDQHRVSWPAAPSPAFLKRITKEHRILSSSLPKHQIYVRTYESRLDLLRCLIIGPANTPYEYAPFLIDLHLGPNYPREPPTAHFHSWTSGMGRINPNLYEEGKICLSLLGTWPGRSESEGWTEKANIYQLLVSLQGLVFVKAPFFNEAGYEGYAETQQYTHESLQYSEKAYVSAKNFVKHALSSPIAGMEDVLAEMYLSGPKLEAGHHEWEQGLLNQVIDRGRRLVDRSEELRGPSKQLGGEDDDDERLLSGDGDSSDPTKVFLKPLSMGAIVMLKKSIVALHRLLQEQIRILIDLEGRRRGLVKREGEWVEP